VSPGVADRTDSDLAAEEDELVGAGGQ
jgi:hypothetical protein